MIQMNFKCLPKISRKWLGLIALNIMLITGGFYLLALPIPHNTTDVSAIDTRLNDIQSRVISLQNEVKKPVEKIDIKEINQDFNKLTALIEQLKSKDDAQLNQLVHDSRVDLSNKLYAIHQTIDSLDKKALPQIRGHFNQV
jgi:phosphoglycerate-specific signal transduction histidine kinase